MNRIVLLLVGGILIAGCAGSGSVPLGIKNGRLADCPGKPNCVVSQGGDEDHHVDPIRYSGDREAAFLRLKQVVQQEPRTRIVSETRYYLHVEFTSALMRFVDDVEFFFPADESVIHVRSASRVGYSDLGVNRRRVERIRAAFDAAAD